jgi:DNA-binding transcriptional LysR family regulator
MQPIQHFQLTGVDLNLLVVFDALMTEQHLTRAAEKIGLSQPATSNALARLRKLFKDDLFIKTSKGITPTPRAIELTSSIRQALEQIQLAVSSQPEFDPEKSDRLFRLGMDDYTEIVFLPKLLQLLEKSAPNIRVLVIPSNWQKAPKQLDEDEADLIIGHCPQFSSWHHKKTLYQENFVCIASKQRFEKMLPREEIPIKNRISLDDYVQARHLLVSLREDMVGIVDEILAKKQLTRKVTVSVPNFLIVPFVLKDTDLIATLPIQIAENLMQSWEIQSFPLSFEMSGFSVDLLWHTKNERELGHQWLRGLIAQLCPFSKH